MQIIGGPSYDPSTGDNSFPSGPAAIGGKVVLHNLSTYDLLLTFGEDTTRQALLHAWQPRIFDFCGKQTPTISYSVPVQPTAEMIASAPTSYLWGESFAPGEPIPESLPNYDRLSNVGNTVTTQGGSANVKNDGNSPGTLFIEATPSDQTQSSWFFNNDGSGYLQILSANVLRSLLNFVRGNNTTGKASATLGDVNDPSILTFYGVIGAGSVVPASVVSGQVSDSAMLGSSLTAAHDANVGAIHTLQAAGAPQGFGVVVWDGAAATFKQLVSDTGVVTADSATNATNATDTGGGPYNATGDTWGWPNGNAAGTSRWRATTTFTGTGPGTYNHNFSSLTGGGTPNYIGITSNETNSTQTVGVDTVGTSTVHVNMPNSWPFYGFATHT